MLYSEIIAVCSEIQTKHINTLCWQRGLISPVLFSLYVNDMPPPSHHVDFALYADDTAIIATSRKPTLLVSYLESYLNEFQRWLSEWKIAINVSKSTAIIFARA